MHDQYDCIIVGHGISGAVLAQTLLSVGKRILVFDSHYPFSASRAAAGMWNPISFKNLKLIWRANEFLSTAYQFYTDIEITSGEHFFHPMELTRIFNSVADSNEWDTRSTSDALKDHITSEQDTSVEKHFFQPYGYGLVRQCGWLDVPLFVEVSKQRLGDRFISDSFDYSALLIQENGISYSGFQAKKIVFCEGSEVLKNPWFNWLPVEPNKGQVLTLHNKNLNAERIIHFGKFLLPLGEGQYRLGATYEFNDPYPEPTLASENELLQTLAELSNETFAVIENKTGYRPTTNDRKPILGFHPTNKSIAIFNGMGSRGVMMAPLCARIFDEMISEHIEPEREINISRYSHLFPG
ncbi:MAG: FAD-binding oxidoreductase [Flavobacteriales bacterium]|nr:FAD-binding oxidoreductase [Flavobacteriales bacterium]